MKPYKLPDYISQRYNILKTDIKKRLNEFENVPESEYAYELCFCICTPQSKARSAFAVVEQLKNLDFIQKQFNPVDILRNPSNYIRFHNVKAERLLHINYYFSELIGILKSNISNIEKRKWIVERINGFGMKESSHFLRNIGFKNLAILDRHILKHLVLCGVYDETPKVASEKNYLSVENSFMDFANFVGIPVDELDLLFWSYETGEILK